METPAPITVADVMRPALTTVDLNDHVAAAAYLLKRAGASALPARRRYGRRPCS